MNLKSTCYAVVVVAVNIPGCWYLLTNGFVKKPRKASTLYRPLIGPGDQLKRFINSTCSRLCHISLDGCCSLRYSRNGADHSILSRSPGFLFPKSFSDFSTGFDRLIESVALGPSKPYTPLLRPNNLTKCRTCWNRSYRNYWDPRS